MAKRNPGIKSTRSSPALPGSVVVGPARRALVILLLVAGCCFWFAYDGRRDYTPLQMQTLGLFVVLACVPAVNAKTHAALEALRNPIPRRRALVALCIAFAAGLYLFILVILEHQTHYPRFHDESMHLIQAQMLARGRLWMPPHPLPQFFETFFIFVTPVYASMQFPGTSILYVPGIWCGWPFWVTSLLVAAVTVGLMYRVVAEAIDGVAGFLAALWLLGSTDFRYFGLMVLSYPAALMFGLAIVWAWLRWRQKPAMLRCAAIGALAGWAAITRPADALCFALPVGFAMLFDLRDQYRHAPSDALGTFSRRIATTGLVLFAAAAPFIMIQLIANRGVTGSWLHTPHALYVERFHPRISYGLGGVGNPATPATTLRQKLDYYRSFVLGSSADYTPATAPRQWIKQRLPAMLDVSLPKPLAIILLPCGLVALTTRPRRVLFAALPLFVLFYAFAAIFASTYVMITAAAIIPLALLGSRVIEEASGRLERFVAPIMVVVLAGIGIMGLPRLRGPVQEQYLMPTLDAVEQQLSSISGRALVFFTYRTGQNTNEEPVFNIDVADIDSARIVRAHDLGPLENMKLIRYYARLQPDRQVYAFDRDDLSLRPLGPVTQLASGSSTPPSESGGRK